MTPTILLWNTKLQEYGAKEGGYVRHMNSLICRAAHLAAVQFYASRHANILRNPSREYGSLLTSYLDRSTTYGDPLGSSIVDDHLVKNFMMSSNQTETPQPDTEQLRQVGYLD
jgi:hypothetical protein